MHEVRKIRWRTPPGDGTIVTFTLLAEPFGVPSPLRGASRG